MPNCSKIVCIVFPLIVVFMLSDIFGIPIQMSNTKRKQNTTIDESLWINSFFDDMYTLFKINIMT